jgi:hypothetical protein
VNKFLVSKVDKAKVDKVFHFEIGLFLTFKVNKFLVSNGQVIGSTGGRVFDPPLFCVPSAL